MAMPLVPYIDAAGTGRPRSVTGRSRIRRRSAPGHALRAPGGRGMDHRAAVDGTPPRESHRTRSGPPAPLRAIHPDGYRHRPGGRNPVVAVCHHPVPYDHPSDLPRGRKEAVDHPGCAPVQ